LAIPQIWSNAYYRTTNSLSIYYTKSQAKNKKKSHFIGVEILLIFEHRVNGHQQFTHGGANRYQVWLYHYQPGGDNSGKTDFAGNEFESGQS
jgi:hypothetical protein